MELWIVAIIVAAVVFAVLGFLVGYQFKQVRYAERVKLAEEEAARIVLAAESKVKDMMLAGKDEVQKSRDQQETEQKKRRLELQEEERRMQQRRQSIDNRNEQLENRTRKLDTREKEIEKKHQEVADVKAKQLKELERVAAMSREDARAVFLKIVEEESRQDAARLMREIEVQPRLHPCWALLPSTGEMPPPAEMPAPDPAPPTNSNVIKSIDTLPPDATVIVMPFVPPPQSVQVKFVVT